MNENRRAVRRRVAMRGIIEFDLGASLSRHLAKRKPAGRSVRIRTVGRSAGWAIPRSPARTQLLPGIRIPTASSRAGADNARIFPAGMIASCVKTS